MYSARQGLIAHLQTGRDEGAFQADTVKRYAGEIREALQNPQALSVHMPAVFVIYLKGKRRTGDGAYNLDVIVATETRTLDVQDNADDALQIAEAIARWLDDNPVYHHGDYAYQGDFQAGIDAETLAKTTDYTFVRLGVSVQESG